MNLTANPLQDLGTKIGSISFFEELLIFSLPFFLGLSTRLDAALVFSVISLFIFFVPSGVLRFFTNLVRPDLRIYAALILLGGTAGLFDVLSSVLLPFLWPHLRLYIPLLAISPLVLRPLLDTLDDSTELWAKNHFKRWGFLCLLIVLGALIRNLLGGGGLSYSFVPDARLDSILESQNFPYWALLLMAPGGFFILGFTLMIHKHLQKLRKDKQQGAML